MLAIGALAWPSSAAAEPTREQEAADDDGMRRGVGIAVGTSAAAVVIGGLTIVVPLYTWEGWCATPLAVPVTTGIVLITTGTVATTVTASVLAHHLRLHRPGLAPDVDLARRRRRGAGIALGVSIGTIALGFVALGVGTGIARRCVDANLRCDNLADQLGLGIGSSLLIGGTLSTVASGTLLRLHRRHGHDQPRARLSATPGGLSIRF